MQAHRRHTGFAAAYAFLAGSCLAAGSTLAPWGLLACWPAASFFMLALAYAGFGPGIFLKREDGSQSGLVWLLHGPYLLTARAAHSLLSQWQGRAVIGTVGGLQLTAWPGPPTADAAVLDLCAEFERRGSFKHYRSVPLLDLIPPPPWSLAACMRAIQDLRAVHASEKPIVVHCALGRWRSAIVATAWLLYSEQAHSVHEAIDLVRTSCPGVFIDHQLIAALLEWQRST